MRRVLLLPCNRGALMGDYFTSPLWRYAHRLLEARGLRRETLMAAVDSIVTIYDPAGDRRELGAIVLEHEAWRVRGYDSPPRLSKFLGDRQLYLRLVEDVARGLKRLRREGCSELYAVLWVAAYQAATYDALIRVETSWPSWATMVLTPPSPLSARKALKLATALMERGERGVRAILREHVAPWEEFWRHKRGRLLCPHISYDAVYSL